jgi:hypothetical protein
VFSIVAALDPNRLEQFQKTKRVYDNMPFEKEFIIPTRNELKVARYLDDNKLMKDVKIIPYTVEKGFNCSKALNIGVRNAKYNNIIITSPEVKPRPDVLEKLSEVLDQNVICRVWDEDETEKVYSVLVQEGYRDQTPAMYFLAMFRKEDIKKINGWDENFMDGYAYEDNDFGERWVRAELPFIVRDDIEGTHQYHPRGETVPNGAAINNQHFLDNRDQGVIYCQNGLSVKMKTTGA